MGIYSEIISKNTKQLNKVAITLSKDIGGLVDYTYEELFDKADDYAAAFSKFGIVKGNRIAIVGENLPEWQMAFLGMMKIEATAALIDASLGKEEILQLIRKSEASLVVMSPKVRQKLDELPPIPTLNLLEGGIPFEGSVLRIPEESGQALTPEVALIIFSSGTTRSAAGSMHSAEALIETIQMMTEANQLTKDEKILSILPNTHIYGVVTCLLGSMLLGASVCYVESIGGEAILTAFKNYQPTIFPCVPKVFELFQKQIIKKLHSKKTTKVLFNMLFPICTWIRQKTGIKLGKIIFMSVQKGFGGQLKLMTCAGAPIEPGAANFYYGMGFDLLITYGLTETNIPIIGNRGKHLTMDTCGKPYPGIEVKLVKQDEKGEGEIYVKSPYMMKGYFEDESATLEAFEDGWFKTGDLGMMDSKGNIRITGRSKENIVLATGKKVTPTDIENQYTKIDGIEELVVCGVPVSGTTHEEVHAFVVKSSAKMDEKSILEALQARGEKLSLYMKFAKVHFLDELPKTSLQKPKRYLLKKYAQDIMKNHHITGFEIDQTNKENISEASTEDIIREMIIKICGIDKERLVPGAHLYSQLGVDSLAAIEIGILIEERFMVSVAALLEKDPTVEALVAYIEAPEQETDGQQAITVSSKKGIHFFVFKSLALLAKFLFKTTTRNEHYIPQEGGYVICANHVSNIDYLWLTLNAKRKTFNKLCCLAKKELFKDKKINKFLIHCCGMIPVDRTGINIEVMRCCKKQLDENWGMIIHPEGTRSENGELKPFKKGAAIIAKEANVPIIPAYIKGAHAIFPRHKRMPSLFDIKHFRRYPVEVIYGTPIDSEGLTADELIRQVEEAIRSLQDQ